MPPSSGPRSGPVVIVGGGAVGSAVAYFLAREPDLAGRVVVVERDPAYRQASSALSASSIRQREVADLERAADRFAGVVLADGARLACDAVVTAAGPWAARIAAMAGLDLPVRARRRSVFVIACRTAIPGCPLLIDPRGVWVRPEGAHFICGVSPPPDRDPDDAPLEPEQWLFDDILWPA